MQEINIRNAQETDLEEIAILATFANKFSSLPEVRKWTKKNLENFPHLHFVALDQDSIIGYIGASSSEDQLTIVDLSVATDHEHEKIGSRLLDVLLDEAFQNGIYIIRAWVHANSITVIPFYHSHGFTISSHFKSENIEGVPDGESFLLMERHLD